ncbi:hypothetical protein MMC17_000109 [Xylographa soralifera]|nr:hypothetical protein [Xylographa soralifera]
MSQSPTLSTILIYYLIVTDSVEEIDLYEILEITRGASKAEIKKAYHKAALSSHPDKVAEGDREAADARFKAVSQAYEILHDEETRELYDAHGMAAFEKTHGGMPDYTDINDIFSQMFGMEGDLPPGFGGSMPRKPRKGPDEIKEWKVSLEEFYKGRTVKLACERKSMCERCKGGNRTYFSDKDKCKKCKGQKVVVGSKVFEMYIPRGWRDGDQKRFEEASDEVPGQLPGDLVFHFKEKKHPVFERNRADLMAHVKVTLHEALCGFSRVVVKHLDGRGIQIDQPRGRIAKPGQVFKIAGDGMPFKHGEQRGDLYLIVDLQLPDDGWLPKQSLVLELQKIPPHPEKVIASDVIDEVEYDRNAKLESFGTSEKNQASGDSDDEEEAGDHGPQCAQQ